MADLSPQAQALLDASRAWAANHRFNDYYRADPKEEQVIRPGVHRKGERMCYLCQDCQQLAPALFMVRDELWASTGLKGIICLSCFEKRIGREVLLDDLKPCSVTEEMLLGAKIVQRTPSQS